MDRALVGIVPRRVAPAVPHTNGNGKHERKATPFAAAAFNFWGAGAVDFPEAVSRIMGPAAYAASWLAYVCMRYRATKLAEPPLWIAEEKDGTEGWVEGDHPLAEILEQPNPDMDMSDLLEIMSLYADATGAVLLVKTRDRGERVRALYPFSADEFTVESTEDRLYGKFTVSTLRGKRDFGPDDVIYYRATDPRNLLGHMAPLDAALSNLNISEDLRTAVRAMLARAVRPGQIASWPQQLTPEEFGRFKEGLAAAYGGVYNSGRTLILEGGGKLDLIAGNLKELDLGPLDNSAIEAVCACFSIIPLLIGLRLDALGGFADSLKPAQTLFYDAFAFPSWTRFEKVLTRGLLRPIDANPLRFIRFDKEKVRALQLDMTARTTEAGAAAAYWTVNEQRQHTGKPPLDDERGDELGRMAAASVFGIPPVSRETEEPDPDDESQNDEKAAAFMPVGDGLLPTRIRRKGAPPPTADVRATLWKAFDERATAAEVPYAEAALALFDTEASDVRAILLDGQRSDFKVETSDDGRTIYVEARSALPLGESERVPYAATYDRKADDYLTDLLARIAEGYKPGGAYHAAWVEEYRALIGETVRVGAAEISAALGVDFTLENPRVRAAIRARANRLAGNVSETTFQRIRDILTEGRAAGRGIREMADEIDADVFQGDFPAQRATTIARTETIGALNAGEHLAAQESGVLQSKEWLTQGDARVRETHVAQDGERVALSDRFRNGLLYPGDQAGSGDETINCRCTLLYHDEPAGGKARAVEALTKREPAPDPAPIVNLTVPVSVPVTMPVQPPRTTRKTVELVENERGEFTATAVITETDTDPGSAD